MAGRTHLSQDILTYSKIAHNLLPLTKRILPGLKEFDPPMWQAEADTELTMSASPSTAVCQILLVYGTRYRVLMEPKQQEIVGYGVFPFASFSKL